MKSNTKNRRIHLRVSQQQKFQIQGNATALGLSVSQYLLKMAMDGRIVSVNSQSLAKELYALNCKLNELERYPAIRAQELRDVVSSGIARIDELLKSGDQIVHSQI